MRFPRLLLLLILALTIAACSPATTGEPPAAQPTTEGETPTTEPVETEEPATPTTEPTATEAPTTAETATPSGTADSLSGTDWTLTSFGAVGEETPVVEGITVTLQFQAGGQAGGSGGCNSYGTDYQVEGNTLSFGEVVSTMMACAGEATIEQEELFYAALNSVGEFELAEDQLTIWYDNGQSALNFVPATAPGDGSSLENPTRITSDPGETGAEVTATIEERNTQYYVLHALEGQEMTVEISSPDDDVLLTVVGKDGMPIKRYQNGPPSWTGELPATQDYYIYAVSVGPDTSYTLSVQIEPL